MPDDKLNTTDVAPLKGYALRLWEMLEEVQAQVELPEDLDDAVASLLWEGAGGMSDEQRTDDP